MLIRTHLNLTGFGKQEDLQASDPTLYFYSIPFVIKKRKSLFTVLNIFLFLNFFSFAQAQVTKTWVPSNGGSWATAANWSPSGIPATNDIVVINKSQTAPITSVPSIALNRLMIQANCQLEPAGNNYSVTVNDSFYVAPGVNFSLGLTVSKFNFVVGSNARANIQGVFTQNAGAPAGIFTNNGALSFSPTAYIAGSGAFVHAAGATLFISSTAGISSGTAATGHVRVTGTRTYNAGGNYNYNGTADQQMGDGFPDLLTGALIIDNPGTVTMPAAARTITTGTLQLLRGSLSTNNGGNRLSMGNSTNAINATILRYDGNISGTLQGANWYAVNYYSSSKSAGAELSGAGFQRMVLQLQQGQILTLTSNVNIPGSLVLTSGIVQTGIYTLNVLGTQTGGASDAYVSGKLQRTIPAGAGTFLFPVGTVQGYSPVSLLFPASSAGGALLVSSNDGDDAQIGTSSFDPFTTVNRNWNLTLVSGFAGVNYSATFTWLNADADAGFGFSSAYAGRFSSNTWTYPEIISRSTNSIQVNGLTGFGKVQIGSCTVPVIETQPLSSIQNVCLNSTAASISVLSSGDNTYQWYKNSTQSMTGAVAITGANADSYEPSSTAVGASYYYVRITRKPGCYINSNLSGAVIVNANPSISNQPSVTNRNYCINSTAAGLSVTANAGSGTISKYEWFINTEPVNSGGTLVSSITSASNTNTYTPTTTNPGTYYYYVVVTNSNGCKVASTVSGAYVITANPTASNAGLDEQLCGVTTTILQGNLPQIGTGLWSIVSGTGGNLSTPSNPASTFSGIQDSLYTLRWSISNSPCTSSADDVVIRFSKAGPQTTGAAICPGATGIVTVNSTCADTGNIPGNINWYTASSGGVLLGTGNQFDPISSPVSGLTNTLTPGTYTFYAECSLNQGCRTAADYVIHPTTAITQQPEQGIICNGASIRLSVSATGKDLTYQWKRNDTLIVGADSFDYETAQGGLYSVEVSGVCGKETSQSVMVVSGTSTHNVEVVEVCDSFTWNGKKYESSGIFTYNYVNATGCSSTDTLKLTVNTTHIVTTASSCDVYEWKGNQYTASGTYVSEYVNSKGCPSADTLHLTVRYSTHEKATVTACDSFAWNGQRYLSSGQYLYNYQNAAGCPSTDTLQLSMYPTPGGQLSAPSVVCNNQPVMVTFTSSKAGDNGPFQLQLNGVAYDNIYSGQSFPTLTSATLNVVSSSLFASNLVGGEPGVVDTSSVELGMRFSVLKEGQITGIRYYKRAESSGEHIGNLWDEAGNRLATAVFSGETASGWQQVAFATPVNVVPGKVYVASYFAPKGEYAFSANTFDDSLVNESQTIVGLKGAAGMGNGVYMYAAQSSFPGNSSPTNPNYWVDVVFTPVKGSASYALTKIMNGGGCTSSAADLSVVNVTVSQPALSLKATNIDCYGLSTGSIEMAGVHGFSPFTFRLGTTNSYTSTSLFQSLSAGRYQLSMKDSAGCVVDTVIALTQADAIVPQIVQTNVNCFGATTGSFSLTTTGGSGNFMYALPGFAPEYQQTLAYSNLTAGVYMLRIKDAKECILDTTVTILQPAPIVASVSALQPTCLATATGKLTINATGGTGVFSYSKDGGENYQLLDSFTQLPAGTYNLRVRDANNCLKDTAVTLVDPAKIRGTITASAATCGNPVMLTFNTASATGPYSIVVNGVTYNNISKGGAFNSGTIARFTHSVWNNASIGVNSLVGEAASLEVGVKFKANVAGKINGIRFYKHAANTGIHSGSLWTTDGNRLATAQFSNETASGWQEVTFSSPVRIEPGKVYVASYFTPTGAYAATLDAFLAPVTSNGGLLSIPSAEDAGGNGLYKYTNSSSFPDQVSKGGANYWVDVVFDPDTTIASMPFTLSRIVSSTGCVSDLDTVSVGVTTVLPNIQFSVTVTDPCYNISNGSINVAGVGCNTPFTYRLNNDTAYQTSSEFKDLALGTYRIWIKDSRNYERDTTVTLTFEKAVWTGANNNNWNTPGNWSTNRIPGPNTHVIIPVTTRTCTVNADAVVASIQIRQGATLNFAKNRKLTVAGKCDSLPPQ